MPGAEGHAASPFERFRELTRKLSAVPKREAEAQRTKKPKRREPTLPA